MKAGRAGVAAAMVLFLPVCFVTYHLTTVFVTAFAEPLIAPVGPWVIIDHFHVELYLEVLFLTACLALRLRRWLVWLVGGIVIPALPVALQAISYIAVSMPPLPHRTFGQEVSLWLAEGVSAGLLACLVWDVAYRNMWSTRSSAAPGAHS
jgi:hypothetical protein